MSENQIRVSATIYYNWGRKKHDMGQYEAAIANYDTAIQLQPDYALAYYDRGNAKAKLKQYNTAIADYDTAIQLEPDNAKTYYNRAEAKRHLGQYKIAIWDYDSAIRLKPNYALTYYNRGNAKIKLGQAREAEQDWTTALKLATQAGNVELKNVKTLHTQQNCFEFDVVLIRKMLYNLKEEICAIVTLTTASSHRTLLNIWHNLETQRYVPKQLRIYLLTQPSVPLGSPNTLRQV